MILEKKVDVTKKMNKNKKKKRDNTKVRKQKLIYENPERIYIKKQKYIEKYKKE